MSERIGQANDERVISRERLEQLERIEAYAVKTEAAILKTCPTIQAVLLRLPATGFENMKDDLRGVLAELGYAISDDSQSTTERSASAQFARESGSVRTRGVATPEMHEGPADFQRTPHGSEGSASPLHPLRAVPGGAAEALARRFHDLYERLAPEYGYETRPETRTFEPYTANGRLMVAVCGELIGSCEEQKPDLRKLCGQRPTADCPSVVHCNTQGYCQGHCSRFAGIERDLRTHRFMRIVEELEAVGIPQNFRGTLLGALEEAAGVLPSTVAPPDPVRAMLKRAVSIMSFHTGRCPMNIPSNYSGMEEHLSEYRAVMEEGQALLAEPKMNRTEGA